ncbi:hypothetical protein B0T10DRAFT_436336 [Thelonectria olida]|uniref:Clr5 domain-containing protein n=1 Tax=Thelonectria olida TaxID=1576542 RepID=A0A9P8WBT1_9HYPO|nr:hypothetical protein B0T10DRAFT_436336 [Thelonectria olida]
MEVPLDCSATSSGQRQWATPEKWQSHREIITELYQSHTLNEVMKTMADKHKFFATVRMYKSHFDKWGLQKHFRAKQVQALLHQKAERDAAQKASSMYIRGKRVDSKKLQAYIDRTSKQNQDRISTAAEGGRLSPSAQRLMAAVVACRTPSPVQSFKTPSTAPDRGQSSNNVTDSDAEELLGLMFPWLRDSLPQTRASSLLLSASDTQARTEKCMRCLRDFAADNFDSGRWSDELGEKGRMELNLVVNWVNIFNDVCGLLGRGQTQRGFRLLRLCFSQYEALLSAGSVCLFFSIYTAIYQLGDYPDLTKRMVGYAHEMSEAKLSVAHPFTVLLGEFFAMDHDEIMSNWKPLIDCYSSFIAEHSNDDGELMFEVVRARNDSIMNQTHAGLVDFKVAEDLLKKDITRWENYTHASSYETVYLKQGLSALYFIQQRYDDLHRIITEIAPWSQSFYLDTLAAVAVNQGNFEQAIEIYSTWFTWGMDNFGVGHDGTVRASIRLENLLRDIGDMDNANVAGIQSELNLDALCVRLGELELQEIHDEEGGDCNEVKLTSSCLNELNVGGDSSGYEGWQAPGFVAEDSIGSDPRISSFENQSGFPLPLLDIGMAEFPISG